MRLMLYGNKVIISSFSLEDTLMSRPSRGLATILVVTALTVVVALVAILVVFEYSKARLVSRTGKSLALIASETADKLTLLIADRYGDIQMLTENLPSRETVALQAHVSSMASAYPLYSSIVVTDETGRVVAATNESRVGTDEGKTALFQTLRKRGGIYWENSPAQAPDEKRGAITFSARMQGGGGEFRGMVKTTVSLHALRESVDQTVQAFQERLTQQEMIDYDLLADNGDVLLASVSGRANVHNLGMPSVLLSNAGQSGYVEEQSLARHVSVITGYAHTGALKGIPGWGWSVLVRQDRATVLAPLYALLWKGGLVAIVVGLPLLGLIVWEANRRRHQGVDNRQSIEWQASILDCIHEGVIAVNTNGIITFMNFAAELLTGWTRQDALGRRLSEIYVVVDEKTRQRIRDPIGMITQGDPLAARERRVFLITRDGTEKHLVQIGSRIHRNNGESLGVAFTFHDTSRHRPALPKLSIVNPES
jgi:two-component system cell cycle sensor histidine kinase/response regulator CckA